MNNRKRSTIHTLSEYNAGLRLNPEPRWLYSDLLAAFLWQIVRPGKQVVQKAQIQEWLGHSDFSTTANIYAHLDYSSKLSSAEAMVNGLGGTLLGLPGTIKLWKKRNRMKNESQLFE